MHELSLVEAYPAKHVLKVPVVLLQLHPSQQFKHEEFPVE
jgi:hypothetical protein